MANLLGFGFSPLRRTGAVEMDTNRFFARLSMFGTATALIVSLGIGLF